MDFYKCVCVYACICEAKVTQSWLTLLQPCGLYSPWNSLDQNTRVGSHFLLQGIFLTQELNWEPFNSPGIEPRSPALQAVSLPAEPPGKPKNTGVGSPALLQQIFPTQELNWGLLHCSQILYKLSYQGSPSSLLVIL